MSFSRSNYRIVGGRPAPAGTGRRWWRWPTAALLAGAATSFAPVALSSAGATTAHHRHDGQPAAILYVATTGHDSGSCTSLASACASLGYALTQAAPNDEILLEPGTYTESANANVVPPSLTGLTISSDPAHGGSATNTVIDATGDSNGLLVEANSVTVRGLTLENANLEGILAEPPRSTWPSSATAPAAGISHITIAGNVVEHNDKSYDTSLPPTAACPASPTDADDCGEGIHLLGVSWSRVVGNDVRDNVGGILLSDGGLPPSPAGPPISVGPTAHNLVAWNTVTDNAFDCGITLPGHDPRAVGVSGHPQPNLAGVYDNLVVHNVSIGNGGSGLLDATPYPGTGSYDNVFADNFASDNGNGGFTLHSHAPQQDVSGIQVIGNIFGPNNLAGDPDTGVTASTGVMLLSVAVPVSVDVSGNTVFSDVNGIAYNSNVTLEGHPYGLPRGHHHDRGGMPANRFFDVAVPYDVYVPPISPAS